MTINAPVQARIINPGDVSHLINVEFYNWTWGERDYAEPPTERKVWDSGRFAFTDSPLPVTFMTAVSIDGFKMIDFITGDITGIRYESGAPGMLIIEMNSDDKRWTKIHGYYNCRPGSAMVSGWLSLTPRR